MSRPPAHSITSPEEAEAASKLASQRSERDDADMAWLAQDVRGRRILHRLFREGQLFGIGFIGSAEVHYREGQRALVAPRFLHLMRVEPAAWALMIREADDDPLQDGEPESA